MIERVCVAGAGAIGSLFAAHLSRVAEVGVLVRRREHAEALRGGLEVSGKAAFTGHVSASTDPEELGDADLVIVACKATQIQAVAATLEGHFPSAVVMTVQNGLGAEQAVRRRGAWPLVSAVTFMSGVRHGDAHVEYELDTETWLGPYAPTATDPRVVELLAEAMIRSGLRARAFPDLLPAQWSKLIFNSAVNSVAAATDLPHVAAFATRDQPADLGNLLFGLIGEGKAVAAAAHIDLYEDPWEMNAEAVAHGISCGGDYAHLPSMLEDVRARRSTEIDWITGALVEQARRFDVPVPLSAAMLALVKGIEASWTTTVRGEEAAT